MSMEMDSVTAKTSPQQSLVVSGRASGSDAPEKLVTGGQVCLNQIHQTTVQSSFHSAMILKGKGKRRFV